MALDIVNPIQNTSYVNKDFESVYAELLDLVKELTYKWDPSISNESDPGVILLKLNAIIADKMAYNLDKNILECFPLSVTQEGNARQLFEQLGYYMKWYRGATTNISIKWIGENTSSTYTIPAFTMVSDYDSSIVYTLVGPSLSNNLYAVGDQILNTDGTITVFKAIQGIPVRYDINGETLIRFSALDSNRRIYFNSSDVAENGIFITNRGANNYSEWTKVDNLTLQAVSDRNRFFKFGVTTDGTTCYLEFPDNAESLFGEGLEITYIRTLGVNGNIPSRTIEKFYQDLVPVENNSIILNSDNTLITNVNSASNGVDPEGINDAYRGYKRTVGTFDTLVTLRDYFNYIVSAEGLVSNAIVSDRTNDIQTTYKVVSKKSLLDNVVTYIEKDSTTNEPLLSAYSLKLYMLKYVANPTTAELYDTTFSMMNNFESESIKDWTNDLKSIQHDYADILSYDANDVNLCYLINKYPIDCNISTQYSLNKQEAEDLVNNVKIAIYKNLNSQKIDFGEEVPIDLIKNVILNADKRIKDVTLGSLSYRTYAVTYTDNPEDGNGTFSSVVLPTEYYGYSSTKEDLIALDIFTKSVLAGVTQFFVKEEDVDYTLNRVCPPIFASGSVVPGRSSDLTYFAAKIASNFNAQIPVVEAPFSDAQGYLIRENETIQLFAPNLLDAAEYSNYVRFEYYLNSNKTIDANQSYKLDTGEWILFYWKDVNGDNILYQYAGYTQGCIISPSFALTPSDINRGSSTGTLVGYSLTQLTPVNAGSPSYPMYMISSSLTGEMSSALSSNIQNSNTLRNTALSGSSKIKIKQSNSVELSVSGGNNYCYWILNDSTNGKYVLFNEDDEFTPTSSGTYSRRRILDTGEYFFYTNSELSQLNILGAGAQIEDVSTSDTPTIWSIDVKDSEDIFNNGVTAFNSNDWFIVTNDTCILTESQYYNLGTGVELMLNGPGVGTTVTITKEGVDLSDYLIVYKTPGGEVVELPVLDLGNNSGWSAKTLLAINVSPTKEQHLLSGQEISFTSAFYQNAWKVVKGADMSISPDASTTGYYTRSYPVSFLASRELSLTGSHEYDITYTDGSGSSAYSVTPQLYFFNKIIDTSMSQDSTGDGPISFDSTNRMSIYFPPSEESSQTWCWYTMLPVGEFVIPIFIPTAASSLTFNVKYYSNLLKLMGTNITNIQGSGVFYLQLKINNSLYQKFDFILNGTHSDPITLQVLNIERYIVYHSSAVEQTVGTKLANLDSDRMYDYTYQVDPDVEIENPLDPASFLNPYHPFNKVTICQFDVDNSNFKVLNKR